MGISKVTVKGTGQLDGPVVINHIVEMDSFMANKFIGNSRYTVIEEFLKIHYPGVKINPKNFGINVVPIKEKLEVKEQKNKLNKSVSKTSSKSNVGGMVLGLIANPLKEFVRDEFYGNEPEVNDETDVNYEQQNTKIHAKQQQLDESLKVIEEKTSPKKEELSIQIENMFVNIVGLNTLECDDLTNNAFKKLSQKLEFALRTLKNAGETDENLKFYKRKLRNAKIKHFLKATFNF